MRKNVFLCNFYLDASPKNAISSVQLTVSVTEKVRDHLDRMTRQACRQKCCVEVANLLLIDSIREYIEKGSSFVEEKPKD